MAMDIEARVPPEEDLRSQLRACRLLSNEELKDFAGEEFGNKVALKVQNLRLSAMNETRFPRMSTGKFGSQIKNVVKYQHFMM